MLAYLDYMFQYAKGRCCLLVCVVVVVVVVVGGSFWQCCAERAHEQIPKHAYTPSAVKPLEFRLSAQLREIIFKVRSDDGGMIHS
jgi:hypothetical protein